MSYYIKNGNTFRVTDEANVDIRRELPVGNYVVKQDQMGFYLEQVDNFKNNEKIYGNTLSRADRIIATFHERPNTTGVLLSGDKGSGKTLLARTLSIKCAQQKIPCVIVNQPFIGDGFNSLIQEIEQPCMVLFDEFEKVYPQERQEQILTLLDGVFPSKKLFVMTVNDKYRIDKHMQNRPGRLFYTLDYKGLGVDFIREYCEDNLNAKQHIDTICRMSLLFSSFSFDILRALVEEMNRYGEAPAEAMQWLNAKPELSDHRVYDLSVKLNGVPYDAKYLDHNVRWVGNPLNGLGFGMYDPKTVHHEDEDEWEWEDYYLTPNQLVKINADTGEFTFRDETTNMEVSLIRQTPKTFDYYNNPAF